jgi:uncharacterized protein YkwD
MTLKNIWAISAVFGLSLFFAGFAPGDLKAREHNAGGEEGKQAFLAYATAPAHYSQEERFFFAVSGGSEEGLAVVQVQKKRGSKKDGKSADGMTLAKEVASLVNKERQAAGLRALSWNDKLTKGAMIRAKELSENFSHDRPDGRGTATIFSEMGLKTGGGWGENIAYGQTTAEDAMASWMSSKGHKENILKKSYRSIGVGVYEENGHVYWVQLFSY